jgi:hypothetical protein
MIIDGVDPWTYLDVMRLPLLMSSLVIDANKCERGQMMMGSA